MRRCSETFEAEMTPAEQEFLQSLIRDRNFTGPHLEIGTAAGGTLCHMMTCFKDQTRPKFVVVDRMTYFPHQQETVQENLRRHGLDPRTVEFRTQTSAQAFRDAQQSKDQFDFMLIDASHKILAVMADLRWTRLLSVGGLCCFHDYSPRFPGVKLSIDRFLSQHDNYEIVDVVDTLLALRKTGVCSSGEVSLLDSAYSLAMYVPLEVDRKLAKWRNSKKKVA
ncbi:MAG: class I SAM-dependent methyltransferase [Planctomycetaceae bacterium]|nr:class I SAM-dependent methyltransferase [Planctomycetaceae bacterium]